MHLEMAAAETPKILSLLIVLQKKKQVRAVVWHICCKGNIFPVGVFEKPSRKRTLKLEIDKRRSIGRAEANQQKQ